MNIIALLLLAILVVLLGGGQLVLGAGYAFGAVVLVAVVVCAVLAVVGYSVMGAFWALCWLFSASFRDEQKRIWWEESQDPEAVHWRTMRERSREARRVKAWQEQFDREQADSLAANTERLRERWRATGEN